HLQDDFKTKIEYDNYLKARFFSLVVFAVSLLSLIIANAINDAAQINDIHLVFFIMSSTIALLFRLRQPSPRQLKTFHKILIYALIVTVLGWSTLLMTILPQRNELIGTYSIVVLSISLLFQLKWNIVASLYSLSLLAILAFAVPLMEPPLPPKIMMTSSLVAISWIISRILYYKEIQNFTISRTLRDQNANMKDAVLKQSIKLKNHEEEKIEEIIFSITKLLGIYTPYTNGHSENVAVISQKIAFEMSLSNEDVKDSYWSGMVHDLGKLLVPIEILNKKGPLEESEYEKIKSHPSWGYEVLCQSESLSSIAKYVLHHHERWDGKGYPDLLKGDEIPLVSQILAVADSWDAMTSERPYRAAMSENDAMSEMRKNRGIQFSPAVVDAFIRLQKERSIA
ncbi:MAG TPA: HD-GYP domain-containing protein, partial [Clostridia bacterium]|nr:HD-GYP domain-containing protein [Clostridia bacterium]